MPTSRPLPVLCPDRVRKIPRSFAWIDTRLRLQFLPILGLDDLALYLFLILASDRQGLSCWRLDRIEREVPVASAASLRLSRQRLIKHNLIAFKPWREGGIDGSYQVLSMLELPTPPRQPSGPVRISDLLSDFSAMSR